MGPHVINLKKCGTSLHVCLNSPLDTLLDERHGQCKRDKAAAYEHKHNGLCSTSGHWKHY